MDEISLTHIGIIDRMVNKTIERMVVHMPHFYEYNDTKFGKITVIPKGIRYVRFWGYSPVPYLTMSKIVFTLHVEKLYRSSYNVYLQLADNSYRTLATITHNDTPIEGTIMYTGDTKIFLAPSVYIDNVSEKFIAKEGLLLFEDKVQHLNDYIFGSCSFSLVIFMLLCACLAWLLGIVQAGPILEKILKL